jgi:hypothetical protein
MLKTLLCIQQLRGHVVRLLEALIHSPRTHAGAIVFPESHRMDKSLLENAKDLDRMLEFHILGAEKEL